MDQTFNGGTETIYATGLTIGAVYKIRVYHYSAGSGSSTFTICVTTPPAAPANDNCVGATLLGVNLACTYTNASSASATQSIVGCAGNADDDVWFRFVATNSVQTITVDPSTAMDPVVELFSGTCGTINSLYCEDNGFSNGNEVISAVGLIPGNTYYIRVYDYYTSTGGAPFQICVTGTATSAPTNDDPCNAIPLPAVTAECSYLNFTTVGATASLGAPTPASCAGGSAPFQGGFNVATADVWFSVVVPASGILSITPQPGYGINDAAMALYSGTCGALTQIACSDDYNFPGATNDFKPYILQTGLTPGSTVYIRYWRFNINTGIFGLCVSSPTNDNCANALYICDLNGYSASTSAAYTPDRPGTGAGQMYGNNETSAGVNLVDGTNSGGPFGGTTFDVNIENNSWITFTAAATTATLTVSIYNCWVGNFPSGGIQMEIFSGTNCNNFVSVSNFEESSTGFVITASGLTIGQDYYLMVDGYAGDICNYTITANTGVAFPEITASANPICTGTSETLTAPAGATSYLWSPGGQTTPTINVSPSSTTTYTCVVEGVCGYKQTLTKTVNVNQLPTLLNSTAVSICTGTAFNTTLTSDIPSTYSWSATANGNVTGETTATQSTSTINNTLNLSAGTSQVVNYNITSTAISSGCVSNQTIAVTVNPRPVADAGLDFTKTCVTNPTGTAIGMTAVGGVTYSWSPTTGLSSSTVSNPTANPTSTTTYTLTSTQTSTGCTATDAVTVTVNTAVPLANAGSAFTKTCTSNATGATIGVAPVVGVIYSWSPSTGLSSSTVSNPTANPTSTTVYTLTATNSLSGCTASGNVTVTVNTTFPVANAGTDFTKTCVTNPSGATIGVASVAGVTYSWSPSTGLSSSTVSNPTTNPSSTTVYTLTSTNTASGCTATSNVTVTVNTTLPVANAGTSFTKTCVTNPSGATIGVAPVAGTTYSWSPTIGLSSSTASNPTANPTSTTVYTLTATNTSSGCTATSNVTVTVNTAVPFVNAISNQTLCDLANTTSVNFTGTPAVGNVYNWTNSNTSIGLIASGSGNIATFSAQNGGTSAISSIITVTPTTTANGCVGSPDSFTISVNPLLNSSFTYPGNTYCQSGTNPSPTITGVAGGTFSGTAGLSINPTTGLINLAASTLTSHVVTYTTIGSCPTSSTFNITVTTAPTSGFSYSQPTYCQESADPSVTYVSGASGGVFSASPSGLSINSTTGQIDLSASSPNVYSVTNFISPSGGCAPSTSTFDVTIFETPTVTAPTSSSICDGTSVTLTGSGNAASYSWNNGIINGVSFTPTNTLTYTVTGLSSNNCVNTALTTITVVSNVLPTFSFGTSLNVCSGLTVPTLPNVSDNGVNGTWSPTVVSNTSSNNYIFTPNFGVCALTTSFNVTVNNLPQIIGTPISTPSGCNLSNGSLTSVNVAGSPVLIYDWTNSTGNSVGSSSDLVNQPAGNYTLSVTDGDGCESQFGPYSIINPNAPTTPTPIVVNQTCTQSTGSITLTGGFTSYELTGINPVQPLVSNSTGIFTNLVTGEYSVFVIDANSCTSTAITITILNDDLLDCDGDGVTTEDEVADGTDPNDPCDYLAGSITLTPSGDYLDADCDGDGVTNGDEIADGTDPENPCDYLIGSITLAPSGDYLTEDCDGDGVTNGDELADGTNPEDPCDYLAGSISLTTLGEFLTTDCDGDGVTNGDEIVDGTDPFDPCSFEVGSITLTLGGLWNDTDCDGDGVTNGDEIADGTDPYDPCSLDELSITLPVTDTTDCDVTIDIPDGFSPNGDLVNDVFVIDNIEYYSKNHFTILNRWGNIVYETDGYMNTWDGRSQANFKIGGEDLPTGTYFYILDLGEDIEGMERYYKGFIFLNR
jgi:gliding motility-associated-like protein